MEKRDDSKPDVEAEAREEIERSLQELKTMCYRLRGVYASLPVSPREEVMLLGEEEMDFPTEARIILECLVNDSFPAAIRDMAKLGRRRRGGG
jgi:hypothetical protein